MRAPARAGRDDGPAAREALSEVGVHHLTGAWGLASVGPFCLKLDAWLRIAGIAHRAVVDATPLRAPRGKLP